MLKKIKLEKTIYNELMLYNEKDLLNSLGIVK